MALIEKEKLHRIRQKAADLLNQTIDQQVTLAVTGLSRSGKTAFITSLVNQLINEGSGDQLTLFNPVHEGRFVAAKRVPQQNMHISRFDYDKAISAFTQSSPVWPEPTVGISEIRLAIRYKPQDSILKYASDNATLYLNITDYPGEWLLDLPMLNQTFEQWSIAMTKLLNEEPRKEKAQPFLESMKAIDPFAKGSEERLAEFAADYTKLLHTYRNDYGLSVIQPGRFILPGELKDAPILQFVPYPFFESLTKEKMLEASPDSFLNMLKTRFNEYKERVVRKFYNEHFLKFDRQIVLADCLTPLNNGPNSFQDLKQAIDLILESFNYGKSSLFSRLFSPKIDKLLFAATKADHVTPEQHVNLTGLLEQLIYQSKKRLEFDEIDMKTLAISSVKATQTGNSKHKGNEIPVVQGRRAHDESLVTVFPGAVPSKLPQPDYWQNNQFKFFDFLPKQAIHDHEALPQIRMDQVLQFLLGDKMR